MATITVSGGSIGNSNGDKLLNGSDESVGDIFGSGKGDIKNYQDVLAGRVANTKINISGNPQIYGAVFGGGEMASIGYWHEVSGKQVFYGNTGTSDVNITGSPEIGTDHEFTTTYAATNPDWTVYDTVTGQLIHTCTSNVFGGSQGDVDPESPQWVSMGRSRRSYVTIAMNDGPTGGKIKGGVFGGAEQGTVAEDTKVTITGGTIGTKVFEGTANEYLFGGVFGGGYGSHRADYNVLTYDNDSTLALGDSLWRADFLAGRVYGNTKVNLEGGLVQGNVFGGASYAYIGGYNQTANGNTILNIGTDAQAGHNDQGPTILGNVYGGNNNSGSALGNAQVNIYHTAHTAANEYPAYSSSWTVDSLEVNALTQGYAINAVFGGGNKADFTPSTLIRADKKSEVNIFNCDNTVRQVFGGGNAASVGTGSVNADTYITIEGGRMHQVFGGGNGDAAHPANIFGTANTTIQAGLIDQVFGGGNKDGDILQTNLVMQHSGSCDDLINEIFGGSNESELSGEIVTTIACSDGNYNEIYGGANNANIMGNVTLNIEGSTITRVFGGSKGSPNTNGANILAYTQAYVDQHPGLGLTAGEGGNVTLNLYGGTINEAFGGSDVNGNIQGVITVNVLDKEGTCALDVNTIYGGSNQTPATALDPTISSPVINVVHIAQEEGIRNTVFGGGNGNTATMTSNPVVNIGYDATTMSQYIPSTYTVPANPHVAVGHHVHGGGEEAQVIGNTTVNINSGTVGTISYTWKHNTPHTQPMDSIDHHDSGSVFGGGSGDKDHVEYAKVTGNTNVNIKGGHVFNSVYGGGELASVTGKATVTVTGGQVGPAPKVDLANNINIPIGLNGVDGYVFGGCQGIGDDPITPAHPSGLYYNLANVGSTEVIINMPMDDGTHANRLWGSVFGGAEDGHVLGDAKVTYISGLMGTYGTTSYDGNIFGGGRNFSKKNYTAGYVGGNTTVEMSGGQLYGSIFGGGRLAITGVSENGIIHSGNQFQAFEVGANTGKTTVHVKGGVVGNPDLIETFTAHSMGDVYGGGKGDMNGIEGHDPASALLLSLTRNTEVVISQEVDTIPTIIYGSVFGGGEVANVGNYGWTVGAGNKFTNIQRISDGATSVTVNGGRIGIDRMRMSYDPADNVDVGHVFGGGEGRVGDPYACAYVNTSLYGDMSLIDVMATVNNTSVTIDGTAFVKGSVYGGAENGHVLDSTYVKINGGQIGSGQTPVGIDEAMYSDADFIDPTTTAVTTSNALAECVHWPYQDPYTPHEPGLVNSGQFPTDGKTWFGNVFGGGSGYYPYQRNGKDYWNRESGKVRGNSRVEITGGHILTSVYGGCETTDVLGNTTVLMSGGTIGVPRTLDSIEAHPLTCYLFGAGKGDPKTYFNTWTNVENVNVEVSGGIIYGSIFGGGEEGHVHNDVVVNVNGSAVVGTHGTSYVDGNVFGAGRGFSGEALTAGTVGGNVTVNIGGGTMLGSIFGGGRLASVGTYFTDPTDPLYGHFKEDAGGQTYGHVTVNISGGTIGNDSESTLTHTKGGNVFGGSMGRLTKLNGDVNRIWPSLAKVKQTEINISGGTIKSNVYGGGELGTVRDDATINITGGTVNRDVYGGGYGSNDITVLTSCDTVASPMQIAGRVYGNTNVNVSDGWVKKSIYGGGEMASVGYITDSIKHPETGANSTFNLSWPYEFTYANGTGTATIEITGGRIGVTGKDVMGNVVKEDNGDLYGGGKGLVGNRYVMAHCANVNEAIVNINYPASNDATPANYKDLDKQCITGAVYGGGENGHVNTDTYITLDNGLIGHAMYGGGKGKDTYEAWIWKIGTAHTSAPDSLANIYSLTAGKVYGNTHIDINGGYVVRSVFGGGNLASVGKGNYAGGVNDYSLSGYGERVTDAADWQYAENSGHTYINITKGTFGTLNPSAPDEVFKDNVPYGSVFGGCRGIAVPEVPRTLTPRIKYCPEDFMGYTNYTHVNIGTVSGNDDDIHIYGSVYGGAQDGHVRWNANVNVNSGEIGVDYNETNAMATVGSTDLNSIHWTDRGNVYGAGSGVGMWDSDGDGVEDSYCNIAGSVTQFVNVNVNGGKIRRNVYGGGNLATVGPPRIRQNHDCPIDSTCVTVNINPNALIGVNTSEGYGGYVYGASRGRTSNTGEFEKYAWVSNTVVNINGAHIKKDVFGGGENGQVGAYGGDLTHSAVVNINNDGTHTALIGVNADALGNVYGGGQGIWGETGFENDTIAGRVMGTATVNINGGEVTGNVFGGGRLGVTHAETYVNVSGGKIDNNVFGGALGKANQIHVLGLRTVNMRHGLVMGSVYGGSRDGDDALESHPVTFANNNTTATASVVNYSGGTTMKHVFGAGDHGKTYGSTYIFIGSNAIMNAPPHTASASTPYNQAYYDDHGDLIITYDVWAGADFGEANVGTFGPYTITGRSDIYIDGTGYDTYNGASQNDSTFMMLGRSVFGCGTLNDGGHQGKQIMIRNYGTAIDSTGTGDAEKYVNATRVLHSIQYADSLIVESSHIRFQGRGLVNLSTATEEYSIYNIFDSVRLVNGSSLFLDRPVNNIGSLHSNLSANLSNSQYPAVPVYTEVNYDGLTTPETDNKIRINKGGYLTVSITEKDEFGNDNTLYGALRGFFHLMTDGVYNAFAYARPKQSTDPGNVITELSHNYATDGGFVSYRDTLNIYDVYGGRVAYTEGIQMPYENHTPIQRAGDQFFRVWRFKEQGQSVLQVVLHAIAKPNSNGFTYYTGTVTLPPKAGDQSFYRIKSSGGSSPVAEINYGSEIATVNAGYQAEGTKWMYYDNNTHQFVSGLDENNSNLTNSQSFMVNHPNNVFGLTAIPTGGLEGGDPVLLCNEANDGLVAANWNTTTSSSAPQVQFLLTHSDKVNGNYAWDPISLTLEQVLGSSVTDEVVVHVQIVTSTQIDQDNDVKTYAMMTHAQGSGTGSTTDIYKAKVLLPAYDILPGSDKSTWTLKKVEWVPNTSGEDPNQLPGHDPFDENTLVVGEPSTYCAGFTPNKPTSDFVGMTMYPSINIDNVNGWHSIIATDPIDLGSKKTVGSVNPIPAEGIKLGEARGENPISFDFDLHYDSDQNVGINGNATMGTVELTLHLDNYKTAEGTDVKFHVHVYRRGKGKGFYLDGENGNFMYSGKFPDAAQPSLAGILYFGENYEPVDSIYVVNKITANAVTNLEWSTPFDEIRIFRYNGGHPLHQDVLGHDDLYFKNYKTVYNNNPAYKGALVDVLTSMDVKSAKVDGAYQLEEREGYPDPASGNLGTIVAPHVIAHAPLFNLMQDATLTISGANTHPAVLKNNFNDSSNGGAACLANGSTMKMNLVSSLENNYVKDGATEEHHGAGAYLEGNATLLVSDDVMINTNKHVNSSDAEQAENVFLNDYITMIHVGTADGSDTYGALNTDSKIGVTKTAWNNMEYMPVVYTEYIPDGDNLLTNGFYGANQIVSDELQQFGLFEYPERKPNTDVYYMNKLYFVKTWVSAVTSAPAGFDKDDIDTPEELAWAISLVNGYNGQTANPNMSFTLTGDIDMGQWLWLPIGVASDPYQGIFDGNGHVVTGIHSPFQFESMGVFGTTEDATVKNLMAEAEFYNGRNVENIGGIIGEMNGGSLINCESAGYLKGWDDTKNIGGLVGKTSATSVIHSSFATDTLHAVNSSVAIGGLVGENSGRLFNAYSNFVLDNEGGCDTIGGLVAVNKAGGMVENCYSIVGSEPYSIAHTNKGAYGSIKYCYSNSDKYMYDGPVQGHGTYGTVKGRKDLGYMYDDNKITLVSGEANAYVPSNISYLDGTHTAWWPGMVSVLNKWVADNPQGLTDLAVWYRPTTEMINGDLPVLGFAKDSTIAVVKNSLFLRYSKDFNGTLEAYNNENAKAALYLYGTATGVTAVPNDSVSVFVNEDAVLMQDYTMAVVPDFNNTTVGITFDNSSRSAHDAFGNDLDYDWHLLATPLSNAPLGITYSQEAQHYWYTYDDGQVESMVGNYLPDHIDTLSASVLKWDFYSYYEPQYHWINLKRNSFSHHHYDYPYSLIEYQNEDHFVPGKGYMMAISKESYLSNTGTLNKDVDIMVTATAPEDVPGAEYSYNKGSNLVGNPFQAYLDLDKVTSGNTVLTDYYIYDADEGVYAPYTQDASVNPRIPSQYIHPHQGFFVLYEPGALDPDSLVMTIEPSMAGTKKDDNYSYFRGSEKSSYPLVNIIAENENGNRELAIVEVGRPELGGVEKVDNLQNANFKLYTRLEENNYSLLYTPVGTPKVPLFFKAQEDGTYTFTWDTHNGTFNMLLLVDNITGVEYDMLTHDSYTFTSYATDYAARFYIVFDVNSVADVIDHGDNFAFFDGTNWVIEGEGQLELIDVTGRVLYSNNVSGEQSRVSFKDYAAGTYMLRLIKSRKNVKSQKIVLY